MGYRLYKHINIHAPPPLRGETRLGEEKTSRARGRREARPAAGMSALPPRPRSAQWDVLALPIRRAVWELPLRGRDTPREKRGEG